MTQPDLTVPDWRIRSLPDGRVVEFLAAQWAPDDGSEPPGSIRVAVTVLIDGVVHTETLLWTSEQLEQAYREAGNRD